MHINDSRKQQIWTELEAKKEQLESLIEYKTKGYNGRYGIMKVKKIPNIFLIWKRDITSKEQLLNLRSVKRILPIQTKKF